MKKQWGKALLLTGGILTALLGNHGHASSKALVETILPTANVVQVAETVPPYPLMIKYT